MPGRRSSHSAIIAFVMIGALFALISLAAESRAQETRREVGVLVAKTLRRVELVSRMARDLDRERLLIDAHTFEKQTVDMLAVEQQIAATKADFDEAAAHYDQSIGRDPSARSAWRIVRERLAAIQPGIAEAVTLSRANQDVEARAEMVRLDSQFAAIECAFNRLINVSGAAARTAQLQMAAIQRSAETVTAFLALGGVVVTAFVGAWTTRIIAQREVEASRYTRELEMRNRELDAFAGRVAHDLRGPLSTISLAGERLTQLAPDDPGASAILRRGVARMEAMIGDLLTLSRAAVGARGGVCDPADVVQKVREELDTRIASDGASMRIDVNPANIQCDGSLLRGALFNLADNAMKYRRRDVPAEIVLEGHSAGRMYVLSMSDNGMGMSPGDLQQIFEPFFRSATVTELPGTGLGLSIVRRVIEASGGTIRVESVLGEGTTFVIHVPVAEHGGATE